MIIDDLKPAPYNPRTITVEAMAGLGAAIENFGDISGIVWNKRSGFLVTGHQRLEVLKQKHGEQLEIVDGAIVGGGHRFPIRIVDWDDATEKAANITANNPFIAGFFDEDELTAIVNELSTADLEFDLDDLRMNELLANAAPAAKPPPADDQDDGPTITASYQIIIQCNDEQDQQKIHADLIERGISCKISTIQATAD